MALHRGVHLLALGQKLGDSIHTLLLAGGGCVVQGKVGMMEKSRVERAVLGSLVNGGVKRERTLLQHMGLI